MEGRGGSVSRCYVLEVPPLSNLASAHQMQPNENLQGLISFMVPSHQGALLPSTNTSLPFETQSAVIAAAYNPNSKTWCNEEVCKRWYARDRFVLFLFSFSLITKMEYIDSHCSDRSIYRISYYPFIWISIYIDHDQVGTSDPKAGIDQNISAGGASSW